VIRTLRRLADSSMRRPADIVERGRPLIVFITCYMMYTFSSCVLVLLAFYETYPRFELQHYFYAAASVLLAVHLTTKVLCLSFPEARALARVRTAATGPPVKSWMETGVEFCYRTAPAALILMFSRLTYGTDTGARLLYTVAAMLVADLLIQKCLGILMRPPNIAAWPILLFCEICSAVPLNTVILIFCFYIKKSGMLKITGIPFYIYIAVLILLVDALLRVGARLGRRPAAPPPAVNVSGSMYSPETYRNGGEQIRQAAGLISELPPHLQPQIRTIAQMVFRSTLFAARGLYDPTHPSLPKSSQRNLKPRRPPDDPKLDALGKYLDTAAHG